MTGPMPITPDDAEFQKWKAAQQVTPDDAEFQAWKAKQAATQTIQPSPLSRAATAALGTASPIGAVTGAILTAADHIRKYGAGPEAVNAAQGIPGGKAAEAFALSQSQGIPYGDAYDRVTKYTASLPTSDRVVGQMVGASPLALIPGNPGAVGAGIAVADQLFNGDPNVGLGDRLKRALVAGPLGYLGGRIAEGAVVAGKAAGALGRAENIGTREANQTATVGPMYDNALAQGQGLTQTSPEIQRVMQLPTMRQSGREIRGADDLMQVPPGNSPEFLHAVYTNLSDKQTELERAIASGERSTVTSNDPKRELANIKALKQTLLDAMDQAGMTEYRPAATEAAQQEAGIQAVKRGYSTMQNAATPSQGGVNQVENTPYGLQRWTSGQSPESPFVPSDADREAAAQGVLAKLAESSKLAHTPVLRIPLPIPSASVRAAPNLLRTLGQNADADLYARLGLLGANAAINPLVTR